MFRAAAAVMPFALVVVLELGLRVIGVGTDLRLIESAGRRGPPGTFRFNPESDRAYYGATNLAGPEPRHFLLRKPPGVFRIVVIGGSTVVGFPYPSELAFPRFLEIILRQQEPGREFEVLNAGITGLGTISEADVFEQALECSPDLVIVYTGHNEFVAPGSVGSRIGVISPAWAPLYYDLRRTRVQQLGMRLVGPRSPRDLKPLMEQLPGDLQIPLDGTKFRLAEEYFRANLQRMVNAAVRARVPLLLTTPIANLRDQPPMRSLFREDLPSDQRRAWDAAFDEGQRLEEQGEPGQALDAFNLALNIDSGHALLSFRRAQVLESLGRDDEAAAAYQSACDLDACRFRAPSSFAKIIAEVADGSHSQLVSFLDTAAEFARGLPCQAPGHELLFEHVHFTYEGNWRLANVLAEQITRRVLMREWSGGPAGPNRDELCGITPQDHFVAMGMVVLMLQRPPLNQIGSDSQVRELRVGLKRELQQLSVPEQMVLGSLSLAQLERDLLGSLLAAYETAGLDEPTGPLLRRAILRQPWRADLRARQADWESRHNVGVDHESP